MGKSCSPLATPAAGTLLRHDMKPDRSGWTVYDVLAGWPVCLGGLSLVGLSFEDANELVDMLNRQDREIDRTARQLVSTAAYGLPKAARPHWSV
jgi:hypothetical protein